MVVPYLMWKSGGVRNIKPHKIFYTKLRFAYFPWVTVFNSNLVISFSRNDRPCITQHRKLISQFEKYKFPSGNTQSQPNARFNPPHESILTSWYRVRQFGDTPICTADGAESILKNKDFDRKEFGYQFLVPWLGEGIGPISHSVCVILMTHNVLLLERP